MKKSLLFTLLMTVFVIALSSCSKQSELQKTCEEANKECPIQADYGMTITSINYDGKNVVYTVDVDEAVYGEDAIAQFNMVKDQMAAAMNESVKQGGDDDIAKMMKLCKEADANLVFNYVGKPSGQSMSIEISSK